jgi:hypothetical protein
MTDAGMPMSALVFWMPMPTYAFFLIFGNGPQCLPRLFPTTQQPPPFPPSHCSPSPYSLPPAAIPLAPCLLPPPSRSFPLPLLSFQLQFFSLACYLYASSDPSCTCSLMPNQPFLLASSLACYFLPSAAPPPQIVPSFSMLDPPLFHPSLFNSFHSSICSPPPQLFPPSHWSCFPRLLPSSLIHPLTLACSLLQPLPLTCSLLPSSVPFLVCSLTAAPLPRLFLSCCKTFYPSQFPLRDTMGTPVKIYCCHHLYIFLSLPSLVFTNILQSSCCPPSCS